MRLARARLRQTSIAPQCSYRAELRSSGAIAPNCASMCFSTGDPGAELFANGLPVVDEAIKFPSQSNAGYRWVIVHRIAREVARLVARTSRARHLGLASHAVLRTLRIKVERFDLRLGEAHGITEVGTCENLRLTVQKLSTTPFGSVPALYQILIYWNFVARRPRRLCRRGRGC
jgi:hypothetical protein